MHYSILILFVVTSTYCGCFATPESIDVKINVETSNGEQTDSIPIEFVADPSPGFKDGVIPDDFKEKVESSTEEDKYSYERASRAINTQIKSLWEELKKHAENYQSVLSLHEEVVEYMNKATHDEKQCSEMVKHAEEKLKGVTKSKTRAEIKMNSINEIAKAAKINLAKITEIEKSFKSKKQEAEEKNENIESEMNKIKESVKEFNQNLNPCPAHKNGHKRVRDAIITSVQKVKEASKGMPTLTDDDKAKSKEVKFSHQKIENSVQNIKRLIDEIDTVVKKNANDSKPENNVTQIIAEDQKKDPLGSSELQSTHKKPKDSLVKKFSSPKRDDDDDDDDDDDSASGYKSLLCVLIVILGITAIG